MLLPSGSVSAVIVAMAVFAAVMVKPAAR